MGLLLADTLETLLARASLLVKAFLGNLLLGGLDGSRVLANRCVSGEVHSFEVVLRNSVLDVGTELALVRLLAFLLQATHVLSDVVAKNTGAVGFSVVFTRFGVIAWEAASAVGNVKSAINSTLESTEDIGASGCTAKTNIEEALEGSTLTINRFNVILFTIDLLLSFVETVQLKNLERTTSQKKTRAVGSRVVGQTDLHTKVRQLVRVSAAEDTIAIHAGIDDLADDVLVGETDDKAVLGSVVLVLVLPDKAFTGKVISLSLTTPAELDLEPLEVSLVLGDLYKTHALALL